MENSLAMENGCAQPEMWHAWTYGENLSHGLPVPVWFLYRQRIVQAFLCWPHLPHQSSLQREIHPAFTWADAWISRSSGLQQIGCWQKILADSIVPWVSKIHSLHNSPDKCELGSRKVKSLGHILLADRVQPDPDKTKTVKTMKEPFNPGEVHSFLGRVNQLGNARLMFTVDCQ